MSKNKSLHGQQQDLIVGHDPCDKFPFSTLHMT